MIQLEFVLKGHVPNCHKFVATSQFAEKLDLALAFGWRSASALR
jgi:hypothetical protein